MSQKTKRGSLFWIEWKSASGEGAEHVDYTGESGERRLSHSDGEAERFYPELKQRGSSVRVGWEPPGMRAGSSACLQNWSTTYRSATQRMSGYLMIRLRRS